MNDQQFHHLIARLHEAQARVETVIRTVPAERWDDLVHSSDGAWRRRDLLAHMAGNDRRQLIRVRVGAGIPHDDDGAALAEEQQVHEWNQARVEERRGRTIHSLIAEMRHNRAELVALLTSLTTEQRDRPMPFRGTPTPLSEMIPTLIDHLDGHAQEIAAVGA